MVVLVDVLPAPRVAGGEPVRPEPGPAGVRGAVQQLPADLRGGGRQQDAVPEEAGGDDQSRDVPVPSRSAPPGPAAARCPGSRAGPGRWPRAVPVRRRRGPAAGRRAAAGTRRRRTRRRWPGRPAAAGCFRRGRPPAAWHRSPPCRPAGERCRPAPRGPVPARWRSAAAAVSPAPGAGGCRRGPAAAAAGVRRAGPSSAAAPRPLATMVSVARTEPPPARLAPATRPSSPQQPGSAPPMVLAAAVRGEQFPDPGEQPARVHLVVGGNVEGAGDAGAQQGFARARLPDGQRLHGQAGRLLDGAQVRERPAVGGVGPHGEGRRREVTRCRWRR